MYSFLTLTLHGSEWLASGPGRSTPEKEPMKRMMMGYRSWSGCSRNISRSFQVSKSGWSSP